MIGAGLFRAVARGIEKSTRRVEAFDRRTFDLAPERLTRLFVNSVHRAGAFDRAIFDASVRRIAAWTQVTVRAVLFFDSRRLEAAVLNASRSLLRFGEYFRGVQTGRLENYLLALALWALGVIAVAALIFSAHSR